MELRQRAQNNSSIKVIEIQREPMRLYYFHELEEWQQDNHYILSGYVKETSSYWSCLKSLTYIHNETGNIYSHLVPSVLVAVLVGDFIYWEVERINYDLSLWEKLNFIQFGFAATFCLALSALFHLFKSHSHSVCRLGNQCDYLGIIIMITGSLISIMLFAFHDVPKWRNFYVSLFICLGGICTVITFNKSFSTPQYRPFRSIMFILFGLSGTLPVLTAVSLYGLQSASDRSKAGWLVAEGVFYILGASLYAMRIPERFYHKESDKLLDHPVSGKFDYFGHSHQLFHLMVVIAAFCHWKALVGCYHYLHTHTRTHTI